MRAAVPFLVLVTAAWPTRAEAQEAEPQLAALESCMTAEQAVIALGQRWEALLSEANFRADAPAPRRFADEVAPALRRAFLSRGHPSSARQLALELLVQLEHPAGEPLFARMLEVGTCPPPWLALAAEGLARLGTERAREATRAAFVASVPAGRAPADAAWSLCAATARLVPGEPPPDVEAAARSLFLFAPQIAVQSCMPLVARLPDAGVLAERVLDGADWPVEVDGPDPRNRRMLEPYARGAALILLGRVGAEGAYERMAAALEDRSLRSQPTRDGAIQGLAALAGPRARQLLRHTLRDRDIGTPRIAHALLRLGDVASAAALREAALDPDAIVEMRVSAANAYTLLAPGRPGLARAWEQALGRAPAIGPPFESLDARMSDMTRRLAIAERCGTSESCWAEALGAPDPQEAARDPMNAPLQRIQIVKGWLDDGETHERVYEVAGDPDNGASVDLATCTPEGEGFETLCAVWIDPDFEPSQPAFYYARVVENPTCRWTRHLCNELSVDCGAIDAGHPHWACCDPERAQTIQERAWTSPIWYYPD